MSGLAQVTAQDQDGHRVVRVSGEVDLSNVAAVTAAIARALPGDAPAVVLDLTPTTYLDSAGIAMLFRLAERLGHRRQELRLVVPLDAPVRAILELTRVEAVMRVAESIDELEGPAPAS